MAEYPRLDPPRRLAPSDLMRMRRFAARPNLTEGTREVILALVAHAEAYTTPEGAIIPEDDQTYGEAFVADIRRVVDRYEAAHRAPPRVATRRLVALDTDCAECAHRAWAHGEQADFPATGEPCHAYVDDCAECPCVGGYRRRPS